MLVRSKGNGEPHDQTGAEVDDPNFPHARSADANVESVACAFLVHDKDPGRDPRSH